MQFSQQPKGKPMKKVAALKGRSIPQHLPAKAPKRTGKRGIGPKDDPLEGLTTTIKAVRASGVAEIRGEKVTEPKEPKKPRQARLPQMEEPAIEALEALAESYDESMKEGWAHLEKADVAKKALLAEMEKLGKTKYVHGRIEIEIKPEGKKIKIKVKGNKE